MPAPKGVRSFVAIDLPADLRSRLGALEQDLDRRIPSGAVRWVRPEGIHLTLMFLGDVSPGDLAPIRDLLAYSASHAGVFRVTVGGLGCFPNARRPRVVWVGVQNPVGELRRLQAEVEGGLVRLGYPSDGRPFSPHLTLGRVRPEAGNAAEAVGQAVEASQPPSLADIPVQAVCLFRSELRPGGAVYSLQGEFPLEGHA